MKYKTDNIVLATYLSLVGAHLVDIEKIGSRGQFIFDNAVQQIVDDFFLGNGKVDPLQYHNEYRKLVTAVRHKLS